MIHLKIERKKGIDGIRIVHNWKLLIVIIALILVLLGILIYFSAKANSKQDNIKNNNIIMIILQNLFTKDDSKQDSEKDNDIAKECIADTDCVAASCCHADSCVGVEKKPDCKGIFCSMSCDGPLDCGAGHCGCVNGKCSIIATN